MRVFCFCGADLCSGVGAGSCAVRTMLGVRALYNDSGQGRAWPGRRDAGTPGRRDAGTPGRRDAGTPGRRDAGTPGRRDAGT
jgi:hypothetical protein